MFLIHWLLALPVIALAASSSYHLHGALISVKLLSHLEAAKEAGELDQTDRLVSKVKRKAELLDSIAGTLDNEHTYGEAKRACRLMSVIFGNRTVSNGSLEYIKEEQEPWSTTTWLPAACFVRILAPSEVVVALGVVTFVHTKFAVRSRGHNPNPGFSSVDQTGVLLDLRDMNALKVNEDATVISVGPGASWGDVYGYLDTYSRSVVGGRHGDVGVAGLLLGGGIPYFAGLTGLPSSKVKSFQVVLANSTLVKANSEQNPDLFYALKGGGPNYGIVTRVELYTIPLHRVWYKLAIYNSSEKTAILAGAARLHEFARKDPKLGFFLNVNSNGFFAGMLYADWTQWPGAYEPFRNLTPIITLANATNGTIFSLMTAISGGSDPDARRYGTSVTHRFDPALYNYTYDRYLSRSQLNGSAAGGLSYTIQPIRSNVASLQQLNGDSPLTIEPVDQDWIVIPVSWGSVQDDAVAMKAAAGLRSDIEQQAEKRGDLLDLVFMNDAAAAQSPLRSYGTASFQRLQGIAHDYDPGAIFQRLQYGGFLLSKA